ncbi:MAG: sporulation protein YabP [Acutalibacteraceae bacterium]
MEENIRINHNIIVEDRKKMTLTGVKDVLSFDEETVVLDTSLGRLTVKGSGLHIVNFDTKSGDLSAEGRLYALVYTTEEKNGGFFSRVFR